MRPHAVTRLQDHIRPCLGQQTPTQQTHKQQLNTTATERRRKKIQKGMKRTDTDKSTDNNMDKNMDNREIHTQRTVSAYFHYLQEGDEGSASRGACGTGIRRESLVDVCADDLCHASGVECEAGTHMHYLSEHIDGSTAPLPVDIIGIVWKDSQRKYSGGGGGSGVYDGQKEGVRRKGGAV